MTLQQTLERLAVAKGLMHIGIVLMANVDIANAPANNQINQQP